jgi:branched-chain amino acid transport system substrate-binding protein
MAMHRRKLLKGVAASGASLAVLKAPYVQAQTGPVQVGFLCVKTGPLASGGIQMEQGINVFFKERGNKLAGRPIELHVADTGGNPAQARTKTQELVERL